MSEQFEGWAIVELMGHRRLAGYVTEQEIAGASFLRLDIAGPDSKVEPGSDIPVTGFVGGTTQFYSPSAVYCITPTTQDIAVTIGRRSHPAPVHRFELEPARETEPDFSDEYENGPAPF